MSMLQPSLPGARVLDLYAGSGALGLEALSRGADHVTFVERAAAALRALGENLDALGARDEAEVVRGDALRYASALEAGAYDVALADPPYETGQADALARAFLAIPFAAVLWIEHRVGEKLPALAGARQRRYGDTMLTMIPARP